jgi:hypothetical protein
LVEREKIAAPPGARPRSVLNPMNPSRKLNKLSRTPATAAQKATYEDQLQNKNDAAGRRSDRRKGLYDLGEVSGDRAEVVPTLVPEASSDVS